MGGKGLFAAFVGLLLALAVAVFVGWDQERDSPQVLALTQWSLQRARQHPSEPALVGLAAGLILGATGRHLWPAKPK